MDKVLFNAASGRFRIVDRTLWLLLECRKSLLPVGSYGWLILMFEHSFQGRHSNAISPQIVGPRAW